ncbi:hypothetical protein [Psychrobacillus sp. NPDC096389]|uniref:hypothetical protein n=1 Tax=Psychrobacillus sp. NPDC096389 TaxID=3364490 RepID=UPI00382B14D0
MEKISELKKYKYLLTFHGGNQLVLETNTNIHQAKKDAVDGNTFIHTENHYTINLSQIQNIKVIVQK